MSSEEKARDIREKVDELSVILQAIRHLADLVLMHFDFDSDRIEFSAGTKQVLIQHYETRKQELEQKVSELP